jgi:glutathione-regulated potassium-efflux system ancillary protein KefC
VIAGIVLGGRLLLRPLLRWIAAAARRRSSPPRALLLVVAIAALMQLVGLSMALGAFLAGVLLAESEYRRELETDIEPFKGLLLGLFFMAVGMSIDFGVLMRSPALMALVWSALLVLKALVIWYIAKPDGHPLQERPVFTLLLAQGGEFAFVVFQAAAGARVLPAGDRVAADRRGGRVDAAVARCCWWRSTVVLPRCRPRPHAARISEPQDAPVIIAGFGRYGQIVGRLLSAQGIKATVLDHDADMVEAARNFGYKVFYGDATRLDLLRTAGAATARCWWWPWTTRSSRCASSTWRASTSRTWNWWRARAT